MRLKGKVAVITGVGAAGGIGFNTAKLYAENGAKLVIIDLDEEVVKTAAEKITEAVPDAEIKIYAGDVTSENDVKKFINLAVETYGCLDILFNNAGITGAFTPIADYPVDSFKKVVDINLNGTFFGMKYALQIMEKQRSGVIISTSSIGGVTALENSVAYVATKHAIIGMTRNVAVEYGKKGIRANAICPGFTMTDMLKGVAKGQSPENPDAFFDNMKQGIPLDRLGEPSDIANLALFLASDDSSYMTGQAFVIDGGTTI